MSKINEYSVLRRHEGDRLYEEGDVRTADENEVKHLVPHVLELIGPAPAAPEPDEFEEKAEPVLENKAEGDAPENKTITGHKAKGK